jgi:hypothetical protein
VPARLRQTAGQIYRSSRSIGARRGARAPDESDRPVGARHGQSEPARGWCWWPLAARPRARDAACPFLASFLARERERKFLRFRRGRTRTSWGGGRFRRAGACPRAVAPRRGRPRAGVNTDPCRAPPAGGFGPRLYDRRAPRARTVPLAPVPVR